MQGLLQRINALTQFKELRDKNLVFLKEQKYHSDDDKLDVYSVHVVYHDESPLKRRRM